eukprot:747593-Hanusia_phi.AAC.5
MEIANATWNNFFESFKLKFQSAAEFGYKQVGGDLQPLRDQKTFDRFLSSARRGSVSDVDAVGSWAEANMAFEKGEIDLIVHLMVYETRGNRNKRGLDQPRGEEEHAKEEEVEDEEGSYEVFHDLLVPHEGDLASATASSQLDEECNVEKLFDGR